MNFFRFVLLITLVFNLLACDKGAVTLQNVDGLSLYWHHEVFSENGRQLELEFYETNSYDNEYELMFNYEIVNKNIIISLLDKQYKGKCQQFPTPDGKPCKCIPRGSIYIPESRLKFDNYLVKLKTSNFEVDCNLKITNQKIILDIPKNQNFTSYIKEVYPIPKDLLYGGVVFGGNENIVLAKSFISDLESNGFIYTTVPNYRYRHLTVGDDGRPIDKHWANDNYSFGILCKMELSFKKAFELAKKHFNKSNLNIYLFSSNGENYENKDNNSSGFYK